MLNRRCGAPCRTSRSPASSSGGSTPVGRFVLDFYCPSHKVAVEVDGDVHDAQQERDSARTSVLEAHGYRVLRFRNEEVLFDLPGVVARIAACAAEQARDETRAAPDL